MTHYREVVIETYLGATTEPPRVPWRPVGLSQTSTVET